MDLQKLASLTKRKNKKKLDKKELKHSFYEAILPKTNKLNILGNEESKQKKPQ